MTDKKPVKKALVLRNSVAPKTAAVSVEPKEKKEKKPKVVRDSFTMPQVDYDLIAELKQRAQKAGLHVKKSELLRAGLQVLAKQTAAQLKQTVVNLEKIKTGRPKKD
ncbi:MAG: hypothetical protein Q8O24_02665 [Gallionellaceae bacterium]|nr:hypothetical protein [Gallionellaceae bacterium]